MSKGRKPPEAAANERTPHQNEPGPWRGREGKSKKLTFNQANVASSRSLRGFLRGEFDPLTLAEQLEHRISHRAAVEKVFDAGFVPYEPETFINQQARDRARRHFRPPIDRTPRGSLGQLPHYVSA
jgi:hypothetical protein